MGRRRNEADVPIRLAARLVVGAYGEQTREFPLASRIRLDGDGVVPRDVGEPPLEVAYHLAISGRVLLRREGVDSGKALKRYGLCLRGGRQLHGARAERDHPPVEGVVLRRQLAHVPHELRFGPMGVEGLLREEAVRSQPRGRYVADSRLLCGGRRRSAFRLSLRRRILLAEGGQGLCDDVEVARTGPFVR